MESEPGPFIGILFDYPDYIARLKSLSGLNLIVVPSSLKFSSQSRSLTSFQYENDILDFIIIYAHLNIFYRQNNYGLEWVKTFRLAGFNTPVIILTWYNPKKIDLYYRQENPFVVKEYNNSIAVLQLPLSINELKSELHNSFPLTIQQYEKCLGIYNEGRMSHELINIARQSDLYGAKICFKNLMTGNVILKELNGFVNEILNTNSLSDFRTNIDRLKNIIEETELKNVH
jgi:hypothetical protein